MPDTSHLEAFGPHDTEALLEVARALGATVELDELLGMIIRHAVRLLDADRATIFLYDAATDELYTRIAQGAAAFRIPLSTGIAGAAARDLEIVNVPDAYADERFNRSVDAQTGYRTRNILACPMTNYEGKLVGVLQVLNKRAGAFTRRDIALAEAFSAQAGVALQRAHLLDEYLEKQRLDQALKLAREIQQSLTPSSAPPLAGFDIACWSRPSDAIGGDYSDFVKLDDERMVVSLGDVCGHGVGPALVSCATRAMLRALSDGACHIDRVLTQVNNLMLDDLPDNRFVTAFLGLLRADGRLCYCSAGQAPLLYRRATDGVVEIRRADGIPLGILASDDNWSMQSLVLQTGDIFAILTDGFYEWARGDGEMFGIDRVEALLHEHAAAPAADLLGAIRAAVEGFADTPQADDLTAIVIKRVGT